MFLFQNFRFCVVALLAIVLIQSVHRNDAFFLDKLDRIKRKFGLPNFLPTSFGSSSGPMGHGSSGLSGLSNAFAEKSSRFSQGVRVCVNFASNFPQGYQQNTCFYCESYRISQIAMVCTGQATIPENINYTQANCIMNACQPQMGGGASQLPVATTQVTSQAPTQA